MRYKILYLIFVFNLIQTYSQQFYTNNGITEFDGSKAAFEPIRAVLYQNPLKCGKSSRLTYGFEHVYQKFAN